MSYALKFFYPSIANDSANRSMSLEILTEQFKHRSSTYQGTLPLLSLAGEVTACLVVFLVKGLVICRCRGMRGGLLLCCGVCLCV